MGWHYILEFDPLKEKKRREKGGRKEERGSEKGVRNGMIEEVKHAGLDFRDYWHMSEVII